GPGSKSFCRTALYRKNRDSGSQGFGRDSKRGLGFGQRWLPATHRHGGGTAKKWLCRLLWRFRFRRRSLQAILLISLITTLNRRRRRLRSVVPSAYPTRPAISSTLALPVFSRWTARSTRRL